MRVISLNQKQNKQNMNETHEKVLIDVWIERVRGGVSCVECGIC